MTVQIVGWALIHSLWQGALIAVVLGLVLAALRRAPAAWRHWACLLALIALPTLPLLTSASTQSALRAATSAPTVEVAAREREGPSVGPKTRSEEAVLRMRGDALNTDNAPRARFDVQPLLPWLVSAWLLGVLLLSLRVLGGYARARRLVHFDTAPVSREIAALAGRVAERLNVRAAVRVLESAAAQVPMVVGVLRPVVLMPGTLLTGLTLPQIEAILAHELAHVRRYDYAINLLQTVVETLFFYHPATWWLSRRLRDEREQACDELAVSVCGGDPVFYSRVLLTVEEWRSARVAFAPAATGGTLALRIRKLIGQEERKLDIGPRWFAGVVTVAAALFAAVSVVSDQADAQPTEQLQAAPAQDTARARPAAIYRYAGSQAADDRWGWAMQTARARRLDRYWIGYVVTGNATTGEWHYLDRNSPVATGDTWLSGHMRFTGDFRNVKFAGISLNEVVGDYAPADYAVFLAFDATSRSPRVARVRFANFVFPMHFNRWPLLWLGELSSAESVRALAELEKQTINEEVRGDLPAAIGAHNDQAAAMPVLLRWLNDVSEPARFRTDVIEALGEQSSPDALNALARVARGNDELTVRAEAVEALGDLPVAAAADTLISFTRTLTSEKLLMEAVESLGERAEPQVIGALEALTRGPVKSLRLEAVETLGELPDGKGGGIVARLARSADDPLVRMEALETLEEMHEALPEVLETLREAAFSDSDASVQIKAAETLGNLDSPQAVEQLARIATEHRDVRVQIEAAEALAEVQPQEPAIRALQRMVRTHAQPTVRIAALEALAETGEPRMVVELVKEVLGSDAPMEVKIEALETLDELPDSAGVPLLERVAASREPMLREKAAELLEERKH
jgi:beta-lactamase regulating signal transducer with metallopeptidase domain/HEAT repeat protein